MIRVIVLFVVIIVIFFIELNFRTGLALLSVLILLLPHGLMVEIVMMLFLKLMLILVDILLGSD